MKEIVDDGKRTLGMDVEEPDENEGNGKRSILQVGKKINFFRATGQVMNIPVNISLTVFNLKTIQYLI
jgi:hypothetical protein